MKPETVGKLFDYLKTLQAPSRLADCRVAVSFRVNSFHLPGWDHLAGFDKWAIIDDTFIRTTNAKGQLGPEFTPMHFTNSIDYALELAFKVFSRDLEYDLSKVGAKHSVRLFEPSLEVSVKNKHKGPAVATLLSLLDLMKTTNTYEVK